MKRLPCIDGLHLWIVLEQSGGPHIDLAYGRRDGLESFAAAAATYMPGGFLRVQGLIESFQMAGLDEVDLVALSGSLSILALSKSVITSHLTHSVIFFSFFLLFLFLFLLFFNVPIVTCATL